MLFGLIALNALKVNLLPDLSYPTLTVRTEYTGAAPTEIETLITQPVEEAVGVVKNLRRLTSVSRTGQSDVVLQFAWGTNMDQAGLEVRDKMEALQLPLELGADVVVHSATKYLGGHGTAIAGVIVDGGAFDYAADPEKFPNYNQPDPSYHGLRFGPDLGVNGALGANLSFILKARVQLLRDIGPAISPFNAFLIQQGVETLSLRMERHVDNALKVATWLQDRPEVADVRYSGLPSSPYHALQQKYSPRGAGSVFGFDLKGGREAGAAFIDHLTLFSNLANIGDVRSLAIHPATTTHAQLDEAGLAKAGINAGTVRLSIGIEHVDDIIADLDQALSSLS